MISFSRLSIRIDIFDNWGRISLLNCSLLASSDNDVDSIILHFCSNNFDCSFNAIIREPWRRITSNFISFSSCLPILELSITLLLLFLLPRFLLLSFSTRELAMCGRKVLKLWVFEPLGVLGFDTTLVLAGISTMGTSAYWFDVAVYESRSVSFDKVCMTSCCFVAVFVGPDAGMLVIKFVVPGPHSSLDGVVGGEFVLGLLFAMCFWIAWNTKSLSSCKVAVSFNHLCSLLKLCDGFVTITALCVRVWFFKYIQQ